MSADTCLPFKCIILLCCCVVNVLMAFLHNRATEMHQILSEYSYQYCLRKSKFGAL